MLIIILLTIKKGVYLVIQTNNKKMSINRNKCREKDAEKRTDGQKEKEKKTLLRCKTTIIHTKNHKLRDTSIGFVY